MERILQFADSKTTGERWIFFSENVRKCVDNAAFSNIHNLFSERVNTTFFAVSIYSIRFNSCQDAKRFKYAFL